MNILFNRVYNIYTDSQLARDIWKTLKFKFHVMEEGTKRFYISKYFDFKMLDSKPLLEEVYKLQVFINKLRVMKIDIPEDFQVGVIITKLPSSLKFYMKKLLQDSEDFSLEKIQEHFQIEWNQKIETNMRLLDILRPIR